MFSFSYCWVIRKILIFYLCFRIKLGVFLMTIYKINDNKLDLISKEDIQLEKHLQKLTEENLELLFNLKFIRSEYQLNKLRPDTLAFNEETNSFVILEYKKDSSFSLIDQGYAYLALLLNNKAEFVLAYNEKTGKSLKVDDIDWSYSKVIFIAQRYTLYQLKAMEFKDLPFELWKVALYENNIVSFEKIKTDKDNDEYIIKPPFKSYSEDEAFKNSTVDLKSVYEEFKNRFNEEYTDGDITITKKYIGFNIDGKRVLNYLPLQTYSVVDLNIKGIKFEDDKELGRYSKSRYNKSDFYKIKVKTQEDGDSVFELIKKIVG